MNYLIRQATKRDLSAVNDLFYQLHKHEHDTFSQKLQLSWPKSAAGQRHIEKHFKVPHHAVFIAVTDDGGVVGYAFGGKTRTHSAWKRVRQYTLANLYVANEYRGAGVGTQLMETFIEWAKAQGAERIRLGVFASNTTAKRLYKKFGFKELVTTMTLDVE